MKTFVTIFGSLLISASAIASPFEGVNKTTPKCFERTFSDAYLKQRPRQTVKAIHMTLLGFNYKGEKIRFADIVVKLKQPKHGRITFKTTMTCDENGRCFIECDGGTGQIAKKNGQLIFKNSGITLFGGCDAEADVDELIDIVLRPTKNGDDLFTLVPAKNCRIPKWFKELAENPGF